MGGAGGGSLFTSFINKYSLDTFKFETIGTESKDFECVGIEDEFAIAGGPCGVRLALSLYATLNTAVFVNSEVLVEGSPAA